MRRKRYEAKTNSAARREGAAAITLMASTVMLAGCADADLPQLERVLADIRQSPGAAAEHDCRDARKPRFNLLI